MTADEIGMEMSLKDILKLQALFLQVIKIWIYFSQRVNDCCFISADNDVGHMSKARSEHLMNVKIGVLIKI